MIISKDEVLKLIAFAKKSPIPILESVLIESDINHVNATVSDMQTEITINIELVQGDFMPEFFAVNASKLKAICKKLTTDGVTISPSFPMTEITSEKNKFVLQSFAAGDFPRMALGEKRIVSRVAQKALRNALEKVVHAAGKRDVRYYLNGVHFKFGKNQITIEASDGHRMAITVIDCENEEFTEERHAIIPLESTREIIKLLKSDDATISLYDNRFCVDSDYFSVKSNLIDGKYPDTSRAIPNISQFISCGREELIDALSMADLFCSKTSAINSIKITFGDCMEITSANASGEKFISKRAGSYSGAEPVECGVCPNYLIDALSSLSEKIVTIYVENDSAIVIHEGNTTMVIMPMRI